jgi:hypothetical protein
MSHIVEIKTQLRDPAAITAACLRLDLPAPVHGTALLYSGQAAGLLVQLPDWKYPVVIDTATGNTQLDNYSGRWGNQEQFDRFLQCYAIELARLEARKKGYTVTEQKLQDGAVRLQIIESH